MEDDAKKLVTIAHLKEFRDEIIVEIGKLIKRNLPNSSKKWLKSCEVKKFLNVSSGTLQTMRNKWCDYFHENL